MGQRWVQLQDLDNELSKDVTRSRWQDLHFADVKPADVLTVADEVIDYCGLYRGYRLSEVVEGQLFEALRGDILLTQQHLEDSICHFGRGVEVLDTYGSNSMMLAA